MMYALRSKIKILFPQHRALLWKETMEQVKKGIGLSLLANFASAWCFYLVTFFLHKGLEEGPGALDTRVYVFTRQLFGLLVFAPFYFRQVFLAKPHLRPSFWIFICCITNLMAMTSFYRAVSLKGAGIANILNMTYPLFVLAFVRPLIGEKLSLQKFLVVILFIFGIALHFLGEWNSFWQSSAGSFFALLSAALAGFSIVCLRGAARNLGAVTILFWIYLPGTCLSFFLCFPYLSALSSHHIPNLMLSVIFGVCAQWLLASSYGRLDAITGSFVSTIRIPIAVLFGTLLLQEYFLWNEWAGAGVIFISNTWLAFYGYQAKRDKSLPKAP